MGAPGREPLNSLNFISETTMTGIGTISPQHEGKYLHPAPIRKAKRRRRKPVVLITGAAEDDRYLLKVMLELWNYYVVEAGSTEESISLAETEHPSLIIMDTTFPFGENLEAMSRIRCSETIRQVPLVLLSGFPQPVYRDAAMKGGATGFLVKPIDFDRLEYYLSSILKSDRIYDDAPGGSR